MRGKGINYDTGFFPGGNNSRESFDADVVGREMRIIADDLHCTAVRVSGGDPERLSVAGEKAAEAGLEVWFAPFPCEMTPERLLPFFADCAGRAEDLRRGGARTVLVTGCELSLFALRVHPRREPGRADREPLDRQGRPVGVARRRDRPVSTPSSPRRPPSCASGSAAR